jgi:hypothetical protein
MPRKFKTADDATTLKLTVSLEDAVPPNHLARFIVDVIAPLDLSVIYARYGERGGEAIAPEVLLLGNLSLDGTKIHADASKSKAVSYKRLLELERQLQTEVDELFARSEQAEQSAERAGRVIPDEIALGQERLAHLAQGKAVLEARAQARSEAEHADPQAKVRAREEKARQTQRPPRGPAPKPPTSGPRDKDQYNFTDPDSRIMKNSPDTVSTNITMPRRRWHRTGSCS